MKQSPFFRLAIAFFVAAFIISALSIAAVMILDARGVFTALVPTDQPTPSMTASTVRHFTDVPVVTAIPPSPTPSKTPTPTDTLTPTNTSTPTAIPTATTIPPTSTRTAVPTHTAVPSQAAKRCVSVAGDSVAHGDGVFEIPGTGFFTGQSSPISAYLQYQYRQRGDSTMQVLNRSASAVGISSANHPSYFSTVEYAQLLQDACAYTVIIPWLNDLSSGGDPGAAASTHIGALSTLVSQLVNASATAKVLVVTYYTGAPAPFALRTFAAGFTPPVIGLFNQQIAAACSGGQLALKQVQCVDANAIFGGMGTSHVIGTMSHQDLDSFLTVPPGGDAANMLNNYFGGNPNGMVTGDGVHLSNSGKAQLAAYLVQFMP